MEDWGAVKARLEDVADGKPYEGTYAVTNLRADIRAALERVEELERERRVSPDDLGVMRDAAGLSERCHELVRRLLKQAQRAEAAEAEVARLREALAEIIELEDTPANDSLGREVDTDSTSSKVLRIARAALRGGGE